jgi:hypothetical protein
VISRRWLSRTCSSPEDQLGDLRREEPLEPSDPLQLPHLIGDPPFKLAIPGREIGSLRGDAVVQLIRPGFQARHHVLAVRPRGHQNDRHECKAGVVLEPAADLDAVELGHHHVEQDQVRAVFFCGSQGLLAVGGLSQIVAVHRKPRLEDVAVRVVIIDNEDACRIVHCVERGPR